MSATARCSAEPETSTFDRRPAITISRVAEEGLQRSGYLALRTVACDGRDGVIYLRGRVPTYYLKQVAQSIALGVQGVRRVVNLIEVLAPVRAATSGHDRRWSE